MSDENDVHVRQALQLWKKKVPKLGQAPSPDEAVGVLHDNEPVPSDRTKSEPMVQLNLRVPESTKKKVRVLAARDDLNLSEVVMRAIELYEEKFGRAPDLR